MNYTQNQKISQISSHTLIIGVDIAKFKHVARAQDYRGVDLSKQFTFENSQEGFEGFLQWSEQVMLKNGCNEIIVGMEPTGQYWLNLVHYLKEHDIPCGVVNPLHVKKKQRIR